MERKLDSDIEEIRTVLLSGASQVTWNKQDVWARIEQKESKKRVWPFALAACVALISLFIFWKVVPTEKPDMAGVTLPVVKGETKSVVTARATEEVGKQETVTKVTQVSPKVQSVLNSENKEIEVIPSIKLDELLPIAVSSINTEIDFKSFEIKPVAVPEKTFAEEISTIDKKEAFGGKKITLVIPEDEKAAVRSNVKVVRFIQKVGEFNRTGDWEPEKKNKIGELWAKFVESTKTNDKSEF